MDCIFCKIANKEIPSQFVFENEYVVAFRDLAPQAPVHILAVPKIHITSMKCLEAGMNGYISKPFIPDAILAKILEVLQLETVS